MHTETGEIVLQLRHLPWTQPILVQSAESLYGPQSRAMSNKPWVMMVVAQNLRKDKHKNTEMINNCKS